MAYWGYHLVLDCAGLDAESIRNPQTIYKFAKQLVNDIDMVDFGEPQIVRFGHSGKEGYTLVQLIETSNIVAHFVEEDNSVYLDVFSCKIFDNDVVIGLVKQYFDAQSVRVTYLTRQA